MDYEKKYKEALELARVAAFNGHQNLMEGIFPELCESEDERIKKDIIDFVRHSVNRIPAQKFNKYIAWLENQGGKKPADKVEPIFEVGDTMRTLQEASNGITEGTPVVVSIDNEYYRCNNEIIAIKDQNNYEYPPINKRHNAWSEEDEKMYRGLHNLIYSTPYCDSRKELSDWFESLKNRYTWKPSDEQILALDSTLQYSQVSHNSYENLNSLYNDLKKLTE